MTVATNANGHRRRQVRAQVLAEETNCAICGEPVNKTLTYNNVSLDDLRLYAEDRGVSDPGALAAISTHFLGNQKRTGKPEVRSLRQLRDLIDNAIDA